MIAERMRAACWVAAGLAVASGAIIALRSPTPNVSSRDNLLQLERDLHDIDRRVKLLIEHDNMTRELLDDGARRQRELERNDVLLRPSAQAATNG